MLRTPTSGFLGLALTLAAGGAFFVALPALAADGFTLKDKPKIAMLYFGPKNDGGWTQAFDEARVKIEKESARRSSSSRTCPKTPRPSSPRQRSSSSAAPTS
jgi:basic membrane protein A